MHAHVHTLYMGVPTGAILSFGGCIPIVGAAAGRRATADGGGTGGGQTDPGHGCAAFCCPCSIGCNRNAYHVKKGNK